MNPNPYLKQYQKTQITTASPEKLLIMLYDGAIQYSLQAKIHLENKNISEAHTLLLRAQAIVTEFMSSLSFDPNPEVARNLYSLYDFIKYKLIQANIKHDPTMIDDAVDILKTLKSAWEEAIVIAAKERKEKDGFDEDSSSSQTV